jgi:copper(I)-binding protein
MLMELKRELKAGETVPLELVVEGADGKRRIVEVDAPVRSIHGKPHHGKKGH